MNRSATHFLYKAAGAPSVQNLETIHSHCWLCGIETQVGAPKKNVIKDTFMDIDKARCPDSNHLCAACVWCFSEQDEVLTKKVDSFWSTASLAMSANTARLEAWQKKNKTTGKPATVAELGIDEIWGGYAVPQRMRTYSHFVVNGVWTPATKANKAFMREVLFNPPKDEWLAIIADTGQKHIIFRAQTAYGRESCVIQFEEQRISYELRQLQEVYAETNALYLLGFSKEEIERGEYARNRMMKVDRVRWREHERHLQKWRGSKIFMLALFLVQKEA